MNILFENRYNINRKMSNEYVNKIECRKINRICAVVLLLSIVIMCLASILSIREVVGICAIMVGVVSIICMIARLSKLSKVKTIVSKLGEVSVKIGDQITVTDSEKTQVYEFDEVSVIYDLRYSFILMMQDKKGVIISKDSFVTGDSQMFKKHIKSSCHNARFLA